jgi:5-methylthioribose kinase
MVEWLTPENAGLYAERAGLVGNAARARVEALEWGVSNVVLRVEGEGVPAVVLKQSREKLRVKQDWRSRLERIWVERDALKLLGERLPGGVVPRVVHDDPANYVFGMTAVDRGARVWKQELLEGRLELRVARRAGEILGLMHRIGDGEALGRFGDLTIFDELRLDPFYRTVARVHPELGGRLGELIEGCEGLAEGERRFVHADFSPKNILVLPEGVVVLDFETAHAGDPAFDLGFFQSHLVLKAVRAWPEWGGILGLLEEFRGSYLGTAGVGGGDPVMRRGLLHLAGCALARVDGKSPVDYLDEPRREVVRRFAGRVLKGGVTDWGEAAGLMGEEAGKMKHYL